MFHVPEKFRLHTGPMRSDSTYGNNGAFMVTSLKLKHSLKVVASDGMGWEHVSVSLHNRCPSWEDMCFIKRLFWDPEDVVIQYHPAESDYVNCHPFTLHLWRPAGQTIPVPDPILIGPK